MLSSLLRGRNVQQLSDPRSLIASHQVQSTTQLAPLSRRIGQKVMSVFEDVVDAEQDNNFRAIPVAVYRILLTDDVEPTGSKGDICNEVRVYQCEEAATDTIKKLRRQEKRMTCVPEQNDETTSDW